MGIAENKSDPGARTDALASSDKILGELERIKSDGSFTGASRLVDLLDYIVNQHLTDPDRKIFAKTIAEEIYDRAPDQDLDNHNIVRVDAGRLRRRLAEYYAGPGQDDPIVIHIDPGGYAPRFETKEPALVVSGTEETPSQEAHRRDLGLGVVAVGVLVALCVGFLIGSIAPGFGPPDDPGVAITQKSGDPRLEAERRARMTKSPSSLQAVTLSDHARNLIFPMFERDQLELSLAMFRQAIRKDDTYFGGYAGASQCLSAMAILMPPGALRHDLLSEARQFVNRAIELSPTNSWSQSALSWTLFAEGQIVPAKEHAELALDLAPNDGNVLDFYGMLMLMTGEFEAAREATDPERTRTSGTGRFANKSFYGAASFHLGMYQDAIDTLTAASFTGDPISAPTLAYLAASYQGLGDTEKARRYALELMENWPSFNPLIVMGRVYSDPDQVTALSDNLLAAGWTGSESEIPGQPEAQ